MSFKKFLIELVFFTYLLGYSLSISAKTVEKCGDTFLHVKILDKKNDALRQFQLYGKKQGESETLLHVTKKGSYFFVRCIKDKEKTPLVLFQEIEGLDSGPEDTFGVFDANTKKMLINRDDWPNGNQEQIGKLLGHPPPFVKGFSGGFFCCFSYDDY